MAEGYSAFLFLFFPPLFSFHALFPRTARRGKRGTGSGRRAPGGGRGKVHRAGCSPTFLLKEESKKRSAWNDVSLPFFFCTAGWFVFVGLTSRGWVGGGGDTCPPDPVAYNSTACCRCTMLGGGGVRGVNPPHKLRRPVHQWAAFICHRNKQLFPFGEGGGCLRRVVSPRVPRRVQKMCTGPELSRARVDVRACVRARRGSNNVSDLLLSSVPPPPYHHPLPSS